MYHKKRVMMQSTYNLPKGKKSTYSAELFQLKNWKKPNKTEHICPMWVSDLNARRLHIFIAPWSFLKEKSAHFPVLWNAELHDITLGNGLALRTEGEDVDWRLAQSEIRGPKERQHSKITFPFSFAHLPLKVFLISWAMVYAIVRYRNVVLCGGHSCSDSRARYKISKFLCEEGISTCKCLELKLVVTSDLWKIPHISPSKFLMYLFIPV